MAQTGRSRPAKEFYSFRIRRAGSFPPRATEACSVTDGTPPLVVTTTDDDPVPRTTAVRRTAEVKPRLSHFFLALGDNAPRSVSFGRRPMAQERGFWGKTNQRSLTTSDVVRASQILKKRKPHLPARHGMSSYASCMAQSKPAGNRHSTSPQRGYRGRVRRCLCYQGRPPDPRISPEQEIGEKNGRHNDSSLLPTHQTPSLSLIAQYITANTLLLTRSTLGYSGHSFRRAKTKRRLD